MCYQVVNRSLESQKGHIMKVLTPCTPVGIAKHAHCMRIGREGCITYTNCTKRHDAFYLYSYEMECAVYYYNDGEVFVREGAFSVSRTTSRHTMEFLKFAVYNGAIAIYLEDAEVTRSFKEFCRVNHVGYLTNEFEAGR